METQRAESADLAPVLEGLLKLGFGIGGLLGLAAGVWMLAAPRNWYEVFPGKVGDFGAMNLHFIRDVGGWNVAGGVLLLFALTNRRRYGGVALVVTLVSLTIHAAAHVAAIVSGQVHSEHWVIDAPLVFAPVIIYLVLLWVWWSLESGRHPGASGSSEEPQLP
jgi:predicted anti-sigma-YlaC factor YlaD